jgi:hypothetical protein
MIADPRTPEERACSSTTSKRPPGDPQLSYLLNEVTEAVTEVYTEVQKQAADALRVEIAKTKKVKP